MSAGEPSGDRWARLLVEKLKEKKPGLTFMGLGGPELQAAGVDVRHNLVSLSSLGFGDVLRNYFRYRAIFHDALAAIRRNRPQAVLLVDFPGFHIRLAKALKRAEPSVPILYYVSPQVWAWGARRKSTIARCVDHLLCILPFEREVYRGSGLSVSWVGHPLTDDLAPSGSREALREEFLGASSSTLVALLPGSRAGEVSRIFPVMLEAARLAHKRRSTLRFIVPKAPALPRALYEAALASYGDLPVNSVEGRATDVLRAADFALVASGTATLQAALLGTPFLILYKAGLTTYWLAKQLIRLPYIGLVNVVAGRTIVPEFLQNAAQPAAVAQSLLDFLIDPARREKMLGAFQDVREKLGPPGASERAAQDVLRFLEEKSVALV